MRVPSSDELVEKLKGDKEFLAAVRGDLAKKVEELEERVKALEPEPPKDMLDLSRWTGIPVEELIEKTPEELEKIAPLVLEVVADGGSITIDTSPTVLSGFEPQGEVVVTANGKPLNELGEVEKGTELELVISAGYYATKHTGFKAKRLVLMSNAAIGRNLYIGRYKIYKGITDIAPEVFIYINNEIKFKNVFRDCNSLTSIPEGLFSGVTGNAESLFANAFSGCTSLTSIPEGLFSGVTGNAKSLFKSTFSGCTSLTSIPEGLFSGVTGNAEILFANAFGSCTSLTTIPEGLFSGVTGSARNLFKSTFNGCKSLTSIPEGLFSGVTGNARDLFAYTFYGCTSLTTIPEGLFSGVTGNANSNTVGLFDSTFYGCTSVKGTTPKINGKKIWVVFEFSASVGIKCFYKCTKLSDYNEIPNEWK